MYRILYLPTTKYVHIVSDVSKFSIAEHIPLSSLVKNNALYHPLLFIQKYQEDSIKIYEIDTQRKAEQKLFKAIKSWNKHKISVFHFLKHKYPFISLIELSM